MKPTQSKQITKQQFCVAWAAERRYGEVQVPGADGPGSSASSTRGLVNSDKLLPPVGTHIKGTVCPESGCPWSLSAGGGWVARSRGCPGMILTAADASGIIINAVT